MEYDFDFLDEEIGEEKLKFFVEYFINGKLRFCILSFDSLEIKFLVFNVSFIFFFYVGNLIVWWYVFGKRWERGGFWLVNGFIIFRLVYNMVVILGDVEK